MSALIVLTTAPDRRTARRLAGKLVDARFAACVTSVPGATSVYLWKGRVERAAETLVWIKTTRRLFSKVQKLIEREHPYDVPEILAIPVLGGSKKYLSWIEDSLK